MRGFIAMQTVAVAHEARISIAGGAPKARIATPVATDTKPLKADTPQENCNNLAIRSISR